MVFSGTAEKGDIRVGMFADLAVLDQDYFTVDDEEIKNIEAEMTIVDGKIVYAKEHSHTTHHHLSLCFRIGLQRIFITDITLQADIFRKKSRKMRNRI